MGGCFDGISVAGTNVCLEVTNWSKAMNHHQNRRLEDHEGGETWRLSFCSQGTGLWKNSTPTLRVLSTFSPAYEPDQYDDKAE